MLNVRFTSSPGATTGPRLDSQVHSQSFAGTNGDLWPFSRTTPWAEAAQLELRVLNALSMGQYSVPK